MDPVGDLVFFVLLRDQVRGLPVASGARSTAWRVLGRAPSRYRGLSCLRRPPSALTLAQPSSRDPLHNAGPAMAGILPRRHFLRRAGAAAAFVTRAHAREGRKGRAPALPFDGGRPTALHALATRSASWRRPPPAARWRSASFRAHPRPGARGGPAAPGRPGRLHGVRHRHLGSVAPKLQVFDFPFLWRDWDTCTGRGRTRRHTRRRTISRPPSRCGPWPGRFVRLPPGDHAVRAT